MVFDEVVVHKAGGGIGSGGIRVQRSYPAFFLCYEQQPVGIVRGVGVRRGGGFAFKYTASQVSSGGGNGVVAISGGRAFCRYLFEFVAQVVVGIADSAFGGGNELGQLCRTPVFNVADTFIKVGGKAAIAVVVIVVACTRGAILEVAQLIGCCIDARIAYLVGTILIRVIRIGELVYNG